jgi:hypothetical protein
MENCNLLLYTIKYIKVMDVLSVSPYHKPTSTRLHFRALRKIGLGGQHTFCVLFEHDSTQLSCQSYHS